VADQPLPQPYSDAEIADVIAQVRDAGSYASSPESREHYERLAATLADLAQLRQDKERLEAEVVAAEKCFKALERWLGHGRILVRWFDNRPDDEDRQRAKEMIKAMYPGEFDNPADDPDVRLPL